MIHGHHVYKSVQFLVTGELLYLEKEPDNLYNDMHLAQKIAYIYMPT